MRWDLINELLKGRGRYLEIGIASGHCSSHISAALKWGVDPAPRKNAKTYFTKVFEQTSDEFFRSLNSRHKFDVIFIDGLHHGEQVYRDVLSALKHLSVGGTIVLHDCNPKSEAAQAVPRREAVWNGDCWKAIAALRAGHPELNVIVIDADEGLGVVVPLTKPAPQPVLSLQRDPFSLSWRDLVSDRVNLLGLVPPSKRWYAVFPRTFEVVTASFGGADKLRPVKMQHGSALAFSDQKVQSGWRTKPAKHRGTPRIRARRIKTLIHEYSNAEIVLWTDGSFEIMADPTNWALSTLLDHDIALFQHPDRHTVASEARVCVKKGLVSSSAIQAQLSRYGREGFPDNVGLFATGIIVRRMTPKIRELGAEWWQEILRSNERDQLSLPYLIWKLKIPVQVLSGNIYTQRLFRFRRHR